MKLTKYKLADIAKVEIAVSTRKLLKEKFLYVYAILWTFITTRRLPRIKPSILSLRLQSKQK